MIDRTDEKNVIYTVMFDTDYPLQNLNDVVVSLIIMNAMTRRRDWPAEADEAWMPVLDEVCKVKKMEYYTVSQLIKGWDSYHHNLSFKRNISPDIIRQLPQTYVINFKSDGSHAVISEIMCTLPHVTVWWNSEVTDGDA